MKTPNPFPKHVPATFAHVIPKLPIFRYGRHMLPSPCPGKARYSIEYELSEVDAREFTAKLLKFVAEHPAMYLCVGKVNEEIEVREIVVNGVSVWSRSP